MEAASSAPSRIKVLIADDHRLFAEALEAILAIDERIEIVGHANDGKEAVELAKQRHPDVILMDISMPVMDGIEAAREQAFAAAGDADVRVGGGVSTLRQYLRAGLVDELHLAITPVLLGRGERLFEDVDAIDETYECVDVVRAPSRVVHVTLARRSR